MKDKAWMSLIWGRLSAAAFAIAAVILPTLGKTDLSLNDMQAVTDAGLAVIDQGYVFAANVACVITACLAVVSKIREAFRS